MVPEDTWVTERDPLFWMFPSIAPSCAARFRTSPLPKVTVAGEPEAPGTVTATVFSVNSLAGQA
jgi:hypothetical protein